MSGNNLHGRAGQRDEIKIKAKQKGSMSMCKCIGEETTHSQIITSLISSECYGQSTHQPNNCVVSSFYK